MNLLTLNYDPLFYSVSDHLDIKDFSSLSQVSRGWRAFAQGNPHWKKIAEKILCPNLPTDDNQSLPEKYFFEKVQTHVLDLITKIRTLHIIKGLETNPYADADRSILQLVSGPLAMRKIKHLQKYLIARDQIALWKKLEPTIPTCIKIPSSYAQMVQCAKQFTILLSKHRITIQTLRFMRFSGISIPSELFELKALENLELIPVTDRPKCPHALTIPPEINCFTQLQRLTLKDQRISSLPSAIGCLVELVYLNVSGNNLSVLPPEIGNLRKLRILNASENKLRSIPKEIGKLAQLVELHLSMNQIESLPNEIVDLKKLKKLYLANNFLLSLPSEFQQLKSLDTLFLNYNDLEEEPKISGDIEVIHVRGNPFYKRKIERVNRVLQFTCAGLFCLYIQIKYRNGLTIN